MIENSCSAKQSYEAVELTFELSDAADCIVLLTTKSPHGGSRQTSLVQSITPLATLAVGSGYALAFGTGAFHTCLRFLFILALSSTQH